MSMDHTSAKHRSWRIKRLTQSTATYAPQTGLNRGVLKPDSSRNARLGERLAATRIDKVLYHCRIGGACLSFA